MTDLDMTKLCAEAMDIGAEESFGKLAVYYRQKSGGLIVEPYDPLHDDAQAMALVKKFPGIGSEVFQNAALHASAGRSFNTNRAIVECVAQMQLERTKAAQSSGQSVDNTLSKVG